MNEQSDARSGGLSRRSLIGGIGAVAAAGAVGGVFGKPDVAAAATTWWFPMTTRPGVTSGYGMRKDPVTGEYTLHDGVDYGIKVGTPVYAMRSGTVAFAGAQGGFGNYVTVQHADGYLTGYGHLSSIATGVGRSVQAGTLVGYSGNTGWSTGPHLHVLMHLNGSPYNPSSILNAAPLATGGTAPTNPSEPKDEDMVLIQSPSRGVAAIGPGYFRALPTAEFIGAAQVLFGDPFVGNDRQFDVWKANAIQGQTVRF